MILLRRAKYLPFAFGAAAAVTVPLVVLGALWRGWPGVLGAVGGVVLVAASFTASTAAVVWAERVRLQLVLPVALATYILKFVTLGAAFAALASIEWSGLRVLGVAVIVTAVAWLTAQVTWTFRAKIVYVELPENTG